MLNVKLVRSDPGRPNVDVVGNYMFTFMVYTHTRFPFQPCIWLESEYLFAPRSGGPPTSACVVHIRDI